MSSTPHYSYADGSCACGYTTYPHAFIRNELTDGPEMRANRIEGLAKRLLLSLAKHADRCPICCELAEEARSVLGAPK